METAKRVAAVVFGLVMLIGGVAGWLVGDDPNPQMAGQVLINNTGAFLGSVVMGFVQRRGGETLRAKHIILASIAGACGLWIVVMIAQNSGGLVTALGFGAGGGFTAGVLLSLVWYGIRGPLPDEGDAGS